MDDLTQTELAAMRGRVEIITVDEILGALRPYRVHPKEFDAWLAAHDREVAAKALDEEAQRLEDMVSGYGTRESGQLSAGRDIICQIRARAATLRPTPSTETGGESEWRCYQCRSTRWGPWGDRAKCHFCGVVSDAPTPTTPSTETNRTPS